MRLYGYWFSIIGNKLADKFIGSDLGLMKDELNGLTISFGLGFLVSLEEKRWEWKNEKKKIKRVGTRESSEIWGIEFVVSVCVYGARGGQLKLMTLRGTKTK